jgi:beta-alanine degradation protein BauB
MENAMQTVKDASPLYEVERRAEHAARPGFRITELQISKTRCRRPSSCCRASASTTSCRCSSATPADADPSMRAKATSRLLQETARAIVTEWRFAPGAETGWHRHAHDYVVVVLTAGKLMQETAKGEIVTELAAGQSYAREEGVEHNVINPNPHDFVFVEVELK